MALNGVTTPTRAISAVAEFLVYISLKASNKSVTVDVVEALFPLYDDVFRRAPGSSLRQR